MVVLLSWLFCAGSLIYTIHLIRQRGLYDGGRVAWVIVLLLVPSWMSISVPIIKFDARSLCALVLLVAFLLEPYQDRPVKGWYFSDLFVLLLIVSMTISQFVWKSISPLAPFDPVREIALPYLVGRIFIRSDRDIQSILPIFCVCITVLAGLALFEAIAKKNPLENVLGGKPWMVDTGNPGAGEELDSVRWGLKRAFAIQTHPIYLGLTFAMALPWAVEAAVQSFAGRAPSWWKLVPFAALAGVVTTGSRAAQICSIIVLTAILFQSFPRFRPALVVLILVGGVGFLTFREEVIQALENYADESEGGQSYVKINGVDVPYSGTKHRDLLDQVYEEADSKAGLVGYGTLMIKIPRDPDMDPRFRSIDNHYLYFHLQYGDLGLTIFGLFAASVIWNLLPPFLSSVGPSGRLAGGLLGAIGGCMVAMRGVWFAPDYATVWLFCAGLSVSLTRWHRESRLYGATNRV